MPTAQGPGRVQLRMAATAIRQCDILLARADVEPMFAMLFKPSNVATNMTWARRNTHAGPMLGLVSGLESLQGQGS